VRLLPGRGTSDAPAATGPRVERFDRLAATSTHALLRVVAGWPGGEAPGPDEHVALLALLGDTTEHGEPLPAPPGSEPSWQASFAMELTVAEDPDTEFVLERGEHSWTLPGPVDVDSEPRLPERAAAGPAELRREIARTRDLLADREAELEEAQESARVAYQHAHEARLERAALQEALEQRDAEQKSAVSRLQERVGALSVELAAANAAREEAELDAAARESRIEDLQLAVERARLAMTAAEQAAEESARMQGALEAQAERREAQLDRLRKDLDSERAVVKDLRDGFTELDAARDRLAVGEVVEPSEEVTDLLAQLARVGAELADARDALDRAARAEELRAEIEEALAQAERELAATQAELADARALMAREQDDAGDLSDRDDEALAELFNAARRAYTEKIGSDAGEASRWRAIALAAVEEAIQRPDFGSDGDEPGEGGLVERVRRRRRQRLLAPLAEARAEALEDDG
jgi:hypothetical protein